MKVAVGFSGGVDSAMVALMLKEQGHDVVGITMSLWDPSFNIPLGAKGCFGPQEVFTLEQTQKTAQKLGIEHVIVPLAKQYRKAVIDYFRDEYKVGRTPNPCVKCNQLMKFGFLLDSARELGVDFDYFATGHYAVIENEEFLKCAKDPSKDQTYFLSRLKKEQLKKVLFPLGNFLKEDVKKLAVEKGFVELVQKGESQDFIQCGDYSLLFEEKDLLPGDFVNTKGEVLGRHKGIIHYTIGMRKGLGIGGLKEALYVIRLDPVKNQVVLGTHPELFSKTLLASEFNNLAIPLDQKNGKAKVKIRHGKNLADAEYSWTDSGSLSLVFDSPQASVTPGQIVCLYQEDTVLGSAIIDSAL